MNRNNLHKLIHFIIIALSILSPLFYLNEAVISLALSLSFITAITCVDVTYLALYKKLNVLHQPPEIELASIYYTVSSRISTYVLLPIIITFISMIPLSLHESLIFDLPFFLVAIDAVLEHNLILFPTAALYLLVSPLQFVVYMRCEKDSEGKISRIIIAVYHNDNIKCVSIRSLNLLSLGMLPSTSFYMDPRSVRVSKRLIVFIVDVPYFERRKFTPLIEAEVELFFISRRGKLCNLNLKMFLRDRGDVYIGKRCVKFQLCSCP